MQQRICIIGVLILFCTFWGCDTPSTSVSEKTVETFENIPGSSLKQMLSSLGVGETRFTCSVTTWNKPGSEKKYQHHSSIHYFPSKTIKKAKGKTATWSFVFTSTSSKTSWRSGEYDNVVKTAICNLPDVKGIEEEMSRRLSEVNSNTGTQLTAVGEKGAYQIHTNRLESSPDEEPPGINPMAQVCNSGFFCSDPFVTIVRIGGEVLQVNVECREWTYYTVYCEGGSGVPHTGGGGTPPGGGGGDVDDPCNPSGPAQFPPPECNDPCNWMAPPVGSICGDTSHFLGSIIIDESLEENPKTECVYNRLTSGSDNTFTTTLAKFAGENTQFDLVIELADLGSSINGNLVSSGDSNPFYLQLNENRINNRTPIEIAITFLHEAIHAEMRRYLYGATDTSTLSDFPGDFGEDWRQYILAKYNVINSGSVTSSEHNAMAQNYVSVIAQGLMKFDNFNQSYEFEHYEALAWNGLTGTEAWNNLSPTKKIELGNNYQDALQGRALECN